MRVRFFDDFSDPALGVAASLVQTWPSASIMQNIAWPGIATPSRLQSYRAFTCTDRAGNIISAGCVRLTHVCPGRFSACFKRGPCTRSPEELRQVMPALEKALRRLGAISVAVNPHWQDQDAEICEAVLERIGYTRVAAYEQTMQTATALVDLKKPEETLRRSFSSRRQKDMRAATSAGVVVRPVLTPNEAAQLNKIMREMACRTGMEIDSQHDFLTQFQFLRERGHLGSVNASLLGGEIIGGSVAFYEGERAYLHIVTTIPGPTKGGRSTSLYWQAMLDAKARGCTWLDLGGYPDPRVSYAHDAAGRQEFKDSFRPHIATLPPIMSHALRPIAAGAYRSLRRLYRESRWKARVKALLQRTG